MGNIVKHTDLSSEHPGPRAYVDLPMVYDESWPLGLWPMGLGPAAAAEFGWFNAQVPGTSDQRPDSQGTLEEL